MISDNENRNIRPKNYMNIFMFLVIVLLAFITYQNTRLSKLENEIKARELIDQNKCIPEVSVRYAKKAVLKVIGDSATGTGFVISSDGFVITNHHVIQGQQSIHLVSDDGKSYLGEVYSTDPKVDIALLKITTDDELIPLEWGNSEILEQGASVFALGYPLGNALKGEISVSKGVFSAKRVSNDGVVEWLQTDVPINSGNSGSPLIDECGNVIGVNVAVIKQAQGLNFAISQKTVEPLIKSLINNPGLGKESLVTTDNELQQPTSSPLRTVYFYYIFISQRNLEDAYNLLSSNLQKTITKDWFNGYKNTLNVFVRDIKEIESDDGSPAIYVNFVSADLVGKKTVFKNWEGTWYLTQENGEWKLDNALINEVK